MKSRPLSHRNITDVTQLLYSSSVKLFQLTNTEQVGNDSCYVYSKNTLLTVK